MKKDPITEKKAIESNIIPFTPPKSERPSRYFNSTMHRDIACYFAKVFQEKIGLIFSEGSFWAPNRYTQCWVEIPDSFVIEKIWQGRTIPARIIKIKGKEQEEIFVPVDFTIRKVEGLMSAIKVELNQDKMCRRTSMIHPFFGLKAMGVLTEEAFIKVHKGELSFEKPSLKQRSRMFLRGKITAAHKALLLSGASIRNSSAFRSGLFFQMLKRYWGKDDDFEDKMIALQQVMGQISCSNSLPVKDQKAVIFYGAAGSGKSTLAGLISEFVPAFARCSVSFADFTDGFKLIKLKGKSLNYIDEFSLASVDSKLFKSIITQAPITASEKYKPNVVFTPMALHLGTTNVLPSFKDGLDASIQRRTLLFTFERGLKDQEKDPNIAQKVLEQDASNIMAFCLEGLLDLTKTGAYHIPPSGKEVFEAWADQADSVTGYVNDSLVLTHQYTDFVSSQTLYADYLAFCEKHKIQKCVQRGAFSERLLLILKGRDRNIYRKQIRVNKEKVRGVFGIQAPLSSTRVGMTDFYDAKEDV